MTEDACAALLSTDWPWPAMVFAFVVSVFAAAWVDRVTGEASDWLQARAWLRDCIAVVACAAGVIPLAAPLGVTTSQWALVSAAAGLGGVVSPWLAPKLKGAIKRKVDSA